MHCLQQKPWFTFAPPYGFNIGDMIAAHIRISAPTEYRQLPEIPRFVAFDEAHEITPETWDYLLTRPSHDAYAVSLFAGPRHIGDVLKPSDPADWN